MLSVAFIGVSRVYEQFIYLFLYFERVVTEVYDTFVMILFYCLSRAENGVSIRGPLVFYLTKKK